MRGPVASPPCVRHRPFRGAPSRGFHTGVASQARPSRLSWEEFRGVVRLVSGEEPRAALARWERDDGVDDDAEEDR